MIPQGSIPQTILHVLEPFASGITTAAAAIACELRECSHVVIHGSRNGVEAPEEVKKRFPPETRFIEWKSAGREISLSGDWKALRELTAILKPYAPRSKKKIPGKSCPDAADTLGQETGRMVVHLHSSKAGFLGRLACRLLGIKAVIYTPHCGAFLRRDIGSYKRKLYWYCEWLGGCFGGRVVGCGPSEGELYKNLGANTTFVSNGVKLKVWNDASRVSPGRLISFTGIASFQKDPALWNAAAAASAAVVKERGFSFCWIGDGPLAGELDRKCIEVTGWKKAREVDALLEKTAVYFSASAWEGLPYGVLEAMNNSCALLLRNVPGNRELVVSGENGFLFDTAGEAAEKLLFMLKDRNALLEMGKRSRKILEEGYTLGRMGEGYRRIYAEALGMGEKTGAFGTAGETEKGAG